MALKPLPIPFRLSILLDRPRTSLKPTSVWDLTILVALVVVIVLIVSVIYDGGLLSQIGDTEAQLRTLREQDATLQEQLSENVAARRIYDEERNLPHPRLQDRDLRPIGNHVDVAWDYLSEDAGKYVDYEIELRSLSHDANCPHDPLVVCAEKPTRFLASDSKNQASRIPADPSQTLWPGRYIWRVAAVPVGTTVSSDTIADDRVLLSHWSAFGSVTLYAKQSERIWSTKHVRVGLDLGQGTFLARREGDGTLGGSEISLIYSVVEHCLEFKQEELVYSRDKCHNFLESRPSESTVINLSRQCLPDESRACVTFVPINKWGAYPAAVKRKEVDLFIGTVTRATARERSGLRFTDGYITFRTQLFAHSSDVEPSQSTVREWLSRDREIGVIKDSTNEYVLNRLLDEFLSLKVRPSAPFPRLAAFHKVTFDSYPPMEAAMDRGELDGILIDDVFVKRPDWKPVRGLSQTYAWKSYCKQFLQADKEEYAIAVAYDDRDSSLYEAVENALKDPLVRNSIRVAR